MTRPSGNPILAELRSPTSTSSLITSLKSLKNEVIGHDQKKEMWIGLGVVGPLARILSTHRGSSKRKHRDANGTSNATVAPALDEGEDARLQAVILVGSFAQGGPAFIPPLQIGQIFPPLLNILSITESSPVLVLAALRTLNTIADSVALAHPVSDSSAEGFHRALYTEQNIANLTNILEQDSPALIVQQQVCLTASLITKTCKEETRRKELAVSGILEALATRLASFVIATGAVQQQYRADRYSLLEISPATTRSKLAPLLQAIGTVISHSKMRTTQFVDAPAFKALFSQNDTNSWKSSWSQLSKQQPKPFLADDSLTDSGPGGYGRRGASHGKYQRTPSYRTSYTSTLEITGAQNFPGSDETPLIAWLIEIVRTESGITRLMAGWVVTLLFRSGVADQRREKDLGMQLIPVLVKMLENDTSAVSHAPFTYDSSPLQSSEKLVMQNAPRVLALLVVDSQELQKAASDAGAIKKLSQLLKRSFDPLPPSNESSLWNPSPDSERVEAREAAGISRLGIPGLRPCVLNVLQMRESVLTALAAMATSKDEYRKAIIDNGVVPFVIDSLKPFDESSDGLQGDNKSSEGGKKLGNPTSVLLAACSAAKALSRSVCTLRTSLIDGGLADPLYLLLKNQDIEVRIAATAVVCNIVLEFSPMRDAIIQAGIVKILCEHAHSMNHGLRLNSVWALKHLVHSAQNSLKMSCLQELGAGWLKQIICNEGDDHSSLGYRGDGSGTPVRMESANAAGEQVDLLNAMDHDNDDDEVNMIDSIGALSKSDSRNKPSHGFSSHGILEGQSFARTEADEAELAIQIRKEEVAVQEQGLDFLRNLICGPGAHEMVDYLFRELGQDKVFDMLATLLRPKVVDAFSRDRRSSGTAGKQKPPQTEIVIAVCYIVVNLAAGLPRHRQLLISQTELLKHLVPLFGHPHPEVRVCCVWIVINLTWTDDSTDKVQCKARAYELKKIGIMGKLEELETDTELDVRERTKTALHQMTDLLH